MYAAHMLLDIAISIELDSFIHVCAYQLVSLWGKKNQLIHTTMDVLSHHITVISIINLLLSFNQL